MISAIVVSYNARDHLRKCLDELERRLPADAEILVVDNASSDGSPELVRDEHPRCRLIALERNVGFGAANNQAAAVARGEHLLLINSDAWLREGSLDVLRDALDRDPRLAIAVPQLRYPDGRLQFSWAPETGVLGEALQMARNRFEARPFAHRQVAAILRRILGGGWVSAACILVRKTAFDEVGGFDESFFMYFEDVDLSRRLRLAGWRLRLVSEAEAFHVKGGSRRSDAGELEYRRGQLRYYRKHRPAWENRTLHRRLRRKFARLERPELRRALLQLVDQAATE